MFEQIGKSAPGYTLNVFVCIRFILHLKTKTYKSWLDPASTYPLPEADPAKTLFLKKRRPFARV